MKPIQDQTEIERLLREHSIPDIFDTKGLSFLGFTYQKGEMICSPLNPAEYILFLVQGSAQMYDLREDGTKLPVAHIADEAVIGDMEFITGCPTGFFVEAAEDSICLALPRERYAAQLHQDLRFLHWLLKEMTEKFIHGMGVEIAPATLEKKVLQFFEKETAGEISAVETLLFQLRCGRRELQRVLKKLCDDGQLERLGRGHYRLTEQNGNPADPADPEHGQ